MEIQRMWGKDRVIPEGKVPPYFGQRGVARARSDHGASELSSTGQWTTERSRLA